MANSRYDCFNDPEFMSDVERVTQGFPVYPFIADVYHPESPFDDVSDDDYDVTPHVVDRGGYGYLVQVNRDTGLLTLIAGRTYVKVEERVGNRTRTVFRRNQGS